MKNEEKSRFAIARAELDERTIQASLKKSISKIQNLLWPEWEEHYKDFFENQLIDGFCSEADCESYLNQKLALLRRILIKKAPDIIIKEMIIYGERRLHAKIGGKRSTIDRELKNSARNKIILHRYQALCQVGKQRDAASIIAKSNNLTATQVRNIIRQHKKTKIKREK
ncbi:MAG: hypothetical protein ACR65R_19940 [Methylomicrobium sp.]